MRRDRTLLLAQAWAAGAALVTMLLLLGLGGGLLWSTLAPDEQRQLWALLQPRLPIVLMVLLALAVGAGLVVQPWVRRWVQAPARLLEQAQVLLRTDVQRELADPEAAGPVQGLAQALNQLAQQRDQLRQDMAAQVAQASLGVAQERNRLAALMSELTQSVVVCNLEGQVLLFNQRARMQFRALSDSPGLARGAELIGLGRSVYTVFDRKLVAHALASVQQRLARGVAQPSAQFVTVTRSGQLLRVQLAPVRRADGAAAPTGDAPEPTASAGSTQATAVPQATAGAVALSGFVLMLDNITREYVQQARQDQQLLSLTEGQRGALANLRAAAEMLDDPDLPPVLRERFLGVVRDEAGKMSQQLHTLAEQTTQELATRWPLEEMLGADFLQAACQRIETGGGLRCAVMVQDDNVWLKLDSFALLQALDYLAQRLKDEFEVSALQLRLLPRDAQHAQLDLVWTGQAMSTETVMGWQMDPMASGNEHSPLSVRDVVQRHGGEFWFERDRLRHQAFFRFLLPQVAASSPAPAEAPSLALGDARPEFYDFDLFANTASSYVLDERPLSSLTYTVFDTETTGLNPGGGDEIIQIGAIRVVNGKLLRGDTIDQLVNPGRLIPEAGIPIHGITQDMVRGQPSAAQVLPAFHAFARDSVLVAHNAAFDMRFLQLKETALGLRFDHPVLDTLLLSAVVHPQQASHRLEAIAERFNITVVGRHTALGDALVTAEVFLKLLPLLAEMGIHTLGQAREAAQKTYYARLKY